MVLRTDGEHASTSSLGATAASGDWSQLSLLLLPSPSSTPSIDPHPAYTQQFHTNHYYSTHNNKSSNAYH